MCDYRVAEKELNIIDKVYNFISLNFVDKLTLDKIVDAIDREDVSDLEKILKELGERL